MTYAAQATTAVAPIVVGIGDGAVNGVPGTRLKTYGLGSCIGIVLVDPTSGVTSLVHVALPDSRLNQKMAEEKPYHFADTAVRLVVQRMLSAGAAPKKALWRVKLAGGASVLKNSDHFDIGKRNLLAVKKALWTQGMAALGEHVGGSHSRTVLATVGSLDVSIHLGTGQVVQL
ncbi:MAG: chemotaxis protein CheD [Polyangiaceae bacterium]